MLIPLHDDNPLQRFPWVTLSIIVLNVAAFGINASLDPHAQRVGAARWGFVPRLLSELPSGAPVRVRLYERSAEAEPSPDDFVVLTPNVLLVGLTLVTSMFMHADLLHLGGNMLFFWIFGNNIEDRLGHILFLAFYLLGGIVATLCHWATSNPPGDAVPMIGASGAVAVMMGAYLVTFPRSNVRVLLLLGWLPLFFTVPAMYLLVLWLLFDVMTLYLVNHGYVANVAFWAHIGGFITGALVMFVLNQLLPQPPPEIDIVETPPVLDPGDPPPDATGIYWEE